MAVLGAKRRASACVVLPWKRLSASATSAAAAPRRAWATVPAVEMVPLPSATHLGSGTRGRDQGTLRRKCHGSAMELQGLEMNKRTMKNAVK
eukprot:Skav227547  [mRNA]  locus=scaffold2241:341748:342023:+ [translate_table: standard]